MRVLKPTATAIPSLQEIRANPIVSRGEKVSTMLALDLSSSCVGWAAGADKKLHRYGKLVFKTTADIGEKLTCFEELLRGLIDTFEPERLIIERPASVRGSTTIRHAEMLGIARVAWYEATGLEIDPEWIIAPISVKKALKVPPGENHDQNKLIMVNKINSLYGLNLRYNRNSKLQTDDDIADAIAVLTAHWRRSK